MEQENVVRQEPQDQSQILKIAEYFFPKIITIIDHAGIKHELRKFLLMGNLGFCNGSKTKIIVRAMPNYEEADILIRSQVIIAGNPRIGWDIYSLSGELIDRLDAMSMSKASRFINKTYPHN